MVSVCLPSDALSQHLPSYLGFSYLGCGVSLHGCSSKAQLLLLTLDEGYLHTAAPPHLERGVAPLSCPWPWAWGSSSLPLPLNLGVGYSHEPGGKGGNWNVGKRFYICLTGNNSWLSYLEQTSLIDPFIVPVYLRCNLRIHFQPQVSGSHYQSIQHRLWEEASLPFLYQVISKVFILCKHYIHGRQLSTWPSLSL